MFGDKHGHGSPCSKGVGSNLVNIKSSAVLGVEADGIFDEPHNVGALDLLSRECAGVAEGTKEGFRCGAVVDHVTDLCYDGPNWAAWVSICECMVGQCFAAFPIFLIVDGEGDKVDLVSVLAKLAVVDFVPIGKEFCVA